MWCDLLSIQTQKSFSDTVHLSPQHLMVHPGTSGKAPWVWDHKSLSSGNVAETIILPVQGIFIHLCGLITLEHGSKEAFIADL